MNTFEKNSSNDTVLTGGLIAVAIAWVAFSAVNVPADTGAGHTAASMVATAGTGSVRPNASPRMNVVPAERPHATGAKVS